MQRKIKRKRHVHDIKKCRKCRAIFEVASYRGRGKRSPPEIQKQWTTLSAKERWPILQHDLTKLSKKLKGDA